MVYGLTYLYRLTDFIEIADAHSASVIVFAAYWAERWGAAYSEAEGVSEKECCFVDCYELGFMGAFGIGYKIIVQGKQRRRRGSMLDNQALALGAKVVQDEICSKWNRMSMRRRMERKDLPVHPGVLFELTLDHTVTVDIDSFMSNKVPATVVVLQTERSG